MRKFLKHIARTLTAHANSMLPAYRREWGTAMGEELEHIDNPVYALRWALGCITTSYTERLRFMNRSDLRVSKWLLSIEALVCFAPLTLLWLAAILNIQRLLGEPGILVATALATIAPLALLLVLRHIAIGRPLQHRTQIGLAVAFGAVGLLQVTAMFAAQGPKIFWFQGEWGIVLLCSVLPALCCLHLSQLATDRPSSSLKPAVKT